MKSIEGYANQKYHQKFLDKIFTRYDKDKDGFLDKNGFLTRIQLIFVEYIFSKFYRI